MSGNTTPGGGGNGIPDSLTAAFGASSFTLITNNQLATPGFLDAFQAVIISRFGFETILGTALSPAQVTEIQRYVGKGASQGGVAAFTNDVADSLCNPKIFTCSPNADPYDPNLNQLFINAATLAAATGHGYIGELNGGIMAFTTNDSGFLPPIGLLTGSSSGVQSVEQIPNTPPVGFIYEEGPIGTGHPIDQGITFPFMSSEQTLFLGYVRGFDKGNVVDQFRDNGLDALAGVPALVANKAVIDGLVPRRRFPSRPVSSSSALVWRGWRPGNAGADRGGATAKSVATSNSTRGELFRRRRGLAPAVAVPSGETGLVMACTQHSMMIHAGSAG